MPAKVIRYVPETSQFNLALPTTLKYWKPPEADEATGTRQIVGITRKAERRDHVMASRLYPIGGWGSEAGGHRRRMKGRADRHLGFAASRALESDRALRHYPRSGWGRDGLLVEVAGHVRGRTRQGENYTLALSWGSGFP